MVHTMTTRDATTALRRFGLGARPGEAARIGADGRAFVLAQLDRGPAALLTAPLGKSEAILADVQRARRELREARQAKKGNAAGAAAAPQVVAAAEPAKPAARAEAKTQPQQPGGPQRTDAAAKADNKGVAPAEPRPARLLREAFVADVEARIVQSATTDVPFLERLVLFWSNHFAVSAGKGAVRGLAGAYEREAIRPNVLGRFADMLKAVAQHPAMLIYLDNAQSIGPTSEVGKRRARGLNENLAREILELHTLGVDGGYTQADVTSLAHLLTGWSVGQIELPQTVPGRFFFAGPRHELGGATVLGRRYAQGGIKEGEAALADLARHPATARHIATKLARHFVAESPPPALVARLETTFRDTDGDLSAVSRALASAPEAWAAPQAKIVPPYDFLVSLSRGFAALEPPLQVNRFAAALGQPTWAPASPKGWPDEDDAWMSPAAIRERLRIAEVAVRKVAAVADPRELAEDLLGGHLSEETRSAIARAETREQGLELLAMSPEFLRR
jgi:uncharacterized protein (DUF1800 family)